MLRIIQIALLFFTIVLSGCKKDNYCIGYKEHTGIVKFKDSCGWIIETLTEGRLKPTNMPLAYQFEGLPVRCWSKRTNEYTCDPDQLPPYHDILLLYEVKLCDIEFNEDR